MRTDLCRFCWLAESPEFPARRSPLESRGLLVLACHDPVTNEALHGLIASF
jgi:hypothetical protein